MIVTAVAFWPSDGLTRTTRFPTRSVNHRWPSGPQATRIGNESPRTTSREVKAASSAAKSAEPAPSSAKDSPAPKG
ncbi:hypothetical protein BE15_04185 [Sorangium cellulosum]|uniref:Uncharacterized protein n=1 Tax=Sorangium cellulosum TaxID=56 RepID=A0A150Q9D0_SORCE|nr:hypothetical protein BE15_04185 [Sorangium cellulosum]